MGSRTPDHLVSRFVSEQGYEWRRSHSSTGTNLLGPVQTALLVALSYYAGTKIGFFLTPAETPISTFWPPNALLLAALLLSPRRWWWALVLAVLPVHLLVQLQTGVPMVRALGWFVGNTGEALLAAICIGHFRKQERLFGSVRGLMIFLAFGVVIAPLVTSFFDAAVVDLTGRGRDYWMLWMTRLTTNMLANITVVPTVLFFVRNRKVGLRKPTLGRWVEPAVLALGVVLVSVLVFNRDPTPQATVWRWCRLLLCPSSCGLRFALTLVHSALQCLWLP